VRATVGETFYNVTVTVAELWRAVGKELQNARHNKDWRPIDVERAGGPSYKTVQAIEGGDAGNVESLDKCARALGLELVDILQSVLAEKVTPLDAGGRPYRAAVFRDDGRGPERVPRAGERRAAGGRRDRDCADAGRRGSATSAASTAAWPTGSKAS